LPIRLSKKKKPLNNKETLRTFASTVKEIFTSTKGLLYAFLFNFVVSYTLFPATLLDNNFQFIDKEDLYLLIVLFTYNLFDTIGKFVAGRKAFELKISTINFSSAARILFIATFLLIDYEVPPNWLFGLDWFKIVNLVLFAFTQGYLTALCAIKAPCTVRESRRA
jgi:hypothetical protein